MAKKSKTKAKPKVDKTKGSMIIVANTITVPVEMGAPTKYDPVATIAATRAYIDSKEDKTMVQMVEVAPSSVDLEEDEAAPPRLIPGPVEYTINLPTLEGLALHLKITRSTLYEWRKDPEKKDFSDIVDELLSKQAASLIHNGVNGKSNSNITKLLLTKHGYVDKQVIDDKRSLLGDVFDAAAKRRKELEANQEE